MNRLLSLFSPRLPLYLVYMLQQVEYEPKKFFQWLGRLPNLAKVMHRQQLQMTSRAKALVSLAYTIWGLTFLAAIAFMLSKNYIIAVFLAATSPILVVLMLSVAVMLAWQFIALPAQAKEVSASAEIFKNHPGVVVAVAGSFGKTTMKELLSTVLAEKLDIAITPGNMNTPIAHARFAQKLSGKEEVLVIEYGEGSPGDVARFAAVTEPDYGIITGLAPNHLDHYGSIEKLAEDIFSLRDSTGLVKLFVNSDGSLIQKYLQETDVTFNENGGNGWSVTNVHNGIDGISFELQKSKYKLKVKSRLLGRHQIAPLAMAAALALDLGMKAKDIEAGLAKTLPFEHRMQPYALGNAWVIDDSYNGNLEGMLAGLELLKELPAKRKVYVTPGLVDQGDETETVHHEIAKKIFEVSPDVVVLMDNSATQIIDDALYKLSFKGKVQIQENPLEYYQNLEYTIAAGDLVLMQNDWTDNYS